MSVYTQSELDLINFLEWLDTSGEVVEWRDAADTTHEDVARRYLAEVEDCGQHDGGES